VGVPQGLWLYSGRGYVLEVTAMTATQSLMRLFDWPAKAGTTNQRASECMIERYTDESERRM